MMFRAVGNPDHDEGVRMIHKALDAGINFIDTADGYSRGESEEIVGEAVRGRREDVVLATRENEDSQVRPRLVVEYEVSDEAAEAPAPTSAPGWPSTTRWQAPPVGTVRCRSTGT